jgi:hypothetical protein
MKSGAKKIKALVVQGLSRRQIAKKLGLTETELEKTFGHELRSARPEARAMVGGALFRATMKGSLRAICFFLKTRGGWSERRYREPEPPEEEAIEDDPPPEIRKAIVRLPCNTRDGCGKAGPTERLAAFTAIHDQLLAEATKRNIPLDFERPQNVKIPEMRRLYYWSHGAKKERDRKD